MSKAVHLRAARRARAAIDTEKRKLDEQIVAARRSGATWREITEQVGISLRGAQLAVAREVNRPRPKKG